jgi:hypothetical protein
VYVTVGMPLRLAAHIVRGFKADGFGDFKYLSGDF